MLRAFSRDAGLLAAELEALGLVPIGKRIPHISAQTGVPVGLVSNGTVATNGVITLVTALATTYSGGIWLRLPASAVVGGAAGLYWAVMSSTTQGQVYTAFVDTASPFTPYIPTGLVAAVGSNAAYTQTTGADITLANVTVPGGAMGTNGVLRSNFHFAAISNSNIKTEAFKLGDTQIWVTNATTSGFNDMMVSIQNRGVQNSQLGPRANSSSVSAQNSTGQTFTAIDTSVDKSCSFTGKIATATDYIILEGFTIEVLPS